MPARHEKRWITAIRPMAAGARARLRQLLAGLDEFHRRQAALERVRHGLVIFDSATGLSFATHPTMRRDVSAG